MSKKECLKISAQLLSLAASFKRTESQMSALQKQLALIKAEAKRV